MLLYPPTRGISMADASASEGFTCTVDANSDDTPGPGSVPTPAPLCCRLCRDLPAGCSFESRTWPPPGALGAATTKFIGGPDALLSRGSYLVECGAPMSYL